ncbi:MAG: hypothetical protein AMXMBFR77_21620 [Phycisphaerales bacterium]|nr:hypothetical protein [Leptolyngbya sp.]MCZ7632379.1 hypothetical protein [Phycisphaerales bacterium]MDL1903593.1 hypothetical protein [Synechococcales cyanobacterium CNB]GIK20065.1 MAG: hypothetical protein BroJett004_22290 [Planctomycetota bacterium]
MSDRPFRHLSLVALAALAVSAAIATAFAAPEPAPVPKRWQLDLKPGPLRVASVELPGEGPRAFYYLTYSVVNHTGEELDLVPSFELATDEGEVLLSGVGVPEIATRDIMARLRDPLLEDQIAIIGRIQQGVENARHGVVIWPANDLKIDEVKVFAAGFSGENETITLIDPRTGQERRLVFRKTLMLAYAVPGDLRLELQKSRPLTEVNRRWIMR